MQRSHHFSALLVLRIQIQNQNPSADHFSFSDTSQKSQETNRKSKSEKENSLISQWMKKVDGHVLRRHRMFVLLLLPPFSKTYQISKPQNSPPRTLVSTLLSPSFSPLPSKLLALRLLRSGTARHWLHPRQSRRRRGGSRHSRWSSLNRLGRRRLRKKSR